MLTATVRAWRVQTKLKVLEKRPWVLKMQSSIPRLLKPSKVGASGLSAIILLSRNEQSRDQELDNCICMRVKIENLSCRRKRNVWKGCLCSMEFHADGGDLKKLKVDHLKAYLRHHRLRLVGVKAVLLERIHEHLESVYNFILLSMRCHRVFLNILSKISSCSGWLSCAERANDRCVLTHMHFTLELHAVIWL